MIIILNGCRSIVLCSLLLSLSLSEPIKADNYYSLITASFVYHFYPRGDDHTEYFDNQFIALSWKNDSIPEIDRFVVGTLRNSSDNRCILIGGIKNWKQLSNKIMFKGMYAYVGEFFANTFSHCGDNGIYNEFRDFTGIGFAPYLYHSLEYKLTEQVALNGGLIFPGVLSFALEFSW